jgi:hypothetical protein
VRWSRLTWRARLGILLTLVGLLAGVSANAHTRSETHSTWDVAGPAIRITFTIPDLEARRLGRDAQPPSDTVLAAYITPRLGAKSAAGPCLVQSPTRAVSAAPGYRRFELALRCPDGKAIQLRDGAFMDLVPTHVNFAQIQTADGTFVEQLFTKDQQTLGLGEEGGVSLKNASFLQYIAMGVMHIFTGVDHQLFLVGLILLSRRLRDLTFVITGFTLGHSITLALAVTGILRPHAEYIDALIGLTIALVGAEAISSATQRPGVVALGAAGLMFAMAIGSLAGLGGLPPLLLIGGGLFAGCYLMVSGHLRDAARLRLVVTLVFGLIHGFGFAADLLQMRLPKPRLAELLVGFNLGVEIGQLTLVLAVVAAVALLSRLRLALPRPLVVDVASAFLAAMGLFWFVSRSYA